MSSIKRRLSGLWLNQKLGRLFGGTLLLLVLIPLLVIGTIEWRELGEIRFRTERHIEAERDADGKITQLRYTAARQDGEKSLEIELLPELTVYWIVIGGLFLLRLILLFALGLPSYNAQLKEILRPLDELAKKADELSRLEFGENKYRRLENAISQLEADESSRLSLGDQDLLGIEAAINNLLVRIRESNRQQARFVNDASHELRTPIAVISGYADMLARWGKDDEKVLDEAISAIRTESSRMQHLVEQLLFLARGDAGRTQLQKEPVKPDELMREAYEESVMIDEKHIYRFAPNLPETTVQADPGLLKQAVRILLDNAAKYTKEGDEILLSTGQKDGRPYLQVQDTGIGMAEADVPHMFERFYRADEARSFEGTGLGLSIAKWIVDKHGGYFEITSREELGTRIRIVL
ncbi:MAG: sensor histidine kinase [Lachnospiraceae bacterium]|nr:sensor histidine kinase [Lachnospiraceae bacterium]